MRILKWCFCINDYRIERINCTAKEMDMKWLDELEDMVFPKNPSL